MSRHIRIPAFVALMSASFLACAQHSIQQSSRQAGDPAMSASGDASCSVGHAPPGTRVLVFSRTKGFRHASIPNGIAAVTELGRQHGWSVEATEDPAVFADSSLRRFAAVVFMSTTGDILDTAQQSAFERYIRAGGGFVGVHSATDTEYDWPWYGQLVGAYFKHHPAQQQATLNVVDRKHISTKCLTPAWSRFDEWYDFRAVPTNVNVLITIDENSYKDAQMGADHPMAWYHRFDGGRAFYTELGHTEASYTDPAYLNHLAGGILWAVTH
jgi:type 1 glutamine amidotransferase